jgi:tetratricopeptide (TPR) repeat protein
LASPDRHRARDHDGRGARVPDPRFGRITDQEHLDVEPELYERYFRGNRVAPRHVGVAPDGTILFDIYLVNDLATIDRALAEHGRFDTALPDPTTLDEAGLLASPDAAARALLEARFLAAADEAERVRLTALALEPTAAVRHPELVRMALRDPSRAVRGQALAAIAGAIEALPLDVFPDALRAAAGIPERRPQLAAALERRAATAEGPERARLTRLARVAAAAQLASPVIEVDSWRAALVGTSAGPRPASPPVDLLLETLDAIGQRQKREPGDARLDALFARTALRAARVHLENGQGNPGFLIEDARAAAERAAAALPGDPGVQALLARAAYLSGDSATAAEAAARALDGLLSFAELELSAEVLDVFAGARVRTLYERLTSEADWPATWVADIAAAYQVLLLHPLGTEQQALAGLEALGNLELYAEQGAFLRAALERYPTSPKLHEFLRWQALRDGDVADLAAVYAEADVPDSAQASWIWYAALAHLVAAERQVTDGNALAALAVYRTSIEQFQQSIAREPQFESSAEHYVGLAWSGVAKVHLDRGDLDAAVAALRQSADANAGGFRHADGLGNTPRAVARALIQLLERTDRGTEAVELESSLAAAGVDL